MTYMQSPELTLGIARERHREQMRLRHECLQIPMRSSGVRAFAVHFLSRWNVTRVTGKGSVLAPGTPESPPQSTDWDGLESHPSVTSLPIA